MTLNNKWNMLCLKTCLCPFLKGLNFSPLKLKESLEQFLGNIGHVSEGYYKLYFFNLLYVWVIMIMINDNSPRFDAKLTLTIYLTRS